MKFSLLVRSYFPLTVYAQRILLRSCSVGDFQKATVFRVRENVLLKGIGKWILDLVSSIFAAQYWEPQPYVATELLNAASLN